MLPLTADGEVDGVDPEQQTLLGVQRHLAVSPQVIQPALRSGACCAINRDHFYLTEILYRHNARYHGSLVLTDVALLLMKYVFFRY